MSSKTIRALHVFPLFGQDLANGSERYAYQLTRALADQGVEIEVLTTRARGAQWKGGFALAWPDYAPGPVEPGITVRHYRTPLAAPRIVGKAAQYLFEWHVQRERRRLGLAEARHSPDECHRIMAAQNRASDWFALLCRGPLSIGLFLALWGALRRADVVLVSFLPLLLVPVVVWAARLRNKPVMVLPFFHANDLPSNSRIQGEALVRANAVLELTGYTAQHLARIWPGARTVEIRGGVHPGALCDGRVQGARFRAKHGLQRVPLILFAGRKESGKRYDLAVEAMQWVQDPAAVLVMVGEDVDRQPVNAPRVRYLGRLGEDDLWDAFDACDVFVSPSEVESLGLVFLEAWARGKPVIGNVNCPAVASLIDDGVDGFLCSDAKSIAQRINLLLGDAALRNSMGQAGKKKVLEKYTWDRVAETVHDLYRECAQ
ncbi:MAG: glycosyltransferase family 4 protein [Bryobacteraceae bacterium]